MWYFKFALGAFYTTMKLLPKLKSLLEKLELSEREITFYIAALKNPRSTVFELAKKCGFPKDRAYQLFESLQEKGLLQAHYQNRRREILPASLKNFSHIIYAKSCKLWKYAETLKKLDPLLPFLNATRASRSIEVFSVNEFPEHWEDVSYWDWEQVFGYGNFEMLIAAEKDSLTADCSFRDRRTKRGKFANPLLLPGPYTNELIKNDSRELRKTQILNISEFSNDIVFIFPTIDRVSVWSKNDTGEVSGSFIHDPDLTRFHYRMHQYLSKISETSRTASSS